MAVASIHKSSIAGYLKWALLVAVVVVSMLPSVGAFADGAAFFKVLKNGVEQIGPPAESLAFPAGLVG